MPECDGVIQHANGQRHLVAPAFGVALEMRVVARRVEIAIRIVIGQFQPEALLKGFHQMLGIAAITTQVEVDRGLEADGLVLGQADFFMQQLHQLAQGWCVGESAGEFHDG